MDWQKDVIRATMAGAGEFPGVQLQFLLQRLEACPNALPHIAEAIRDMAAWFEWQAQELEAEGRRRAGRGEIVSLQK